MMFIVVYFLLGYKEVNISFLCDVGSIWNLLFGLGCCKLIYFVCCEVLKMLIQIRNIYIQVFILVFGFGLCIIYNFLICFDDGLMFEILVLELDFSILIMWDLKYFFRFYIIFYILLQMNVYQGCMIKMVFVKYVQKVCFRIKLGRQIVRYVFQGYNQEKEYISVDVSDKNNMNFCYL